ncbi:GlcG/HbpS family heme-binding protein [Pseudomonas palleroniana]|uniref:Heme-binding protein n=1 Tax=Pseudomonas palleroniana TaxID=191390 RepID=A0A2L1JDF7_9PSED|nr:heme-binding protein [Pseudomonas palleroniana]AVE06519.1 heme-binding protein [Pseudomonas palleroniana]UOK38481.1 heme-binding protein [Pseudomonas palleroniana]UOP13281.1 heme-binding protein [Pseudomonas palleroniana]
MPRHALFLSLAVCTGALAAPPLPHHADLDLHTARQLADAGLEHCNAALTVVDRGGNLLLSLRADGVGPHNSLASQRKAYTALSTKTPTRLFAERARNNPEAANLNSLPELLLLGGGVPLFADAQLVGALGVAGAGGAAQDETCAVQAAQQLGLSISL